MGLIRMESSGVLTTIRLNRPDVRNALDDAMKTRLAGFFSCRLRVAPIGTGILTTNPTPPSATSHTARTAKEWP